MSEKSNRNITQKRSEGNEWDQEIVPIVESVLSKIRLKQAVEVGKRAVDYFRGNDFKKWVLTNRDFLKSKFHAVLDESFMGTEEDAKTLGDLFIQKGFIARADYMPLEGTSEKLETKDGRRPKWPKRLAASSKQIFDDNAFYIVLYEGNKTWKHIMLGCIIVLVLVLCMFPAWPLTLKIAVWYLSVVFLTLILILVVLRLICFVGLWFFGFDFWIFPNLFDEECGVIDSFIPYYSFTHRKDQWAMVAARLFCALLLSAGIYELQRTHSLSDVGFFAKQSFVDILDWGTEKLAAGPSSGLEKPKYASIDDIKKITEEDASPSPFQKTDFDADFDEQELDSEPSEL